MSNFPSCVRAAATALLALTSLTACESSSPAPASGSPTIPPAPRVEPTPPAPTGTPRPSPTPTPTPTDPSGLYVGPASVAKYVQKFVDDARDQGADVTGDLVNPRLEIRIASLDSYGTSVIGLCETGGGRRRVTFDPDFWDRVSETQRELLAHHEFGHCVLYRGHRTTKLATGAYASIMYPIILTSSTYLNNQDYYLQELFSLSAQQTDPELAVTHICNLEDLP